MSLAWGVPVTVLRETIDADEFDGWCRFYRHCPFDPESLHWGPAAMITATIINAHGGDKNRNAVSAERFIPSRARSTDEVQVGAAGATLESKWAAFRSRHQAAQKVRERRAAGR